MRPSVWEGAPLQNPNVTMGQVLVPQLIIVFTVFIRMLLFLLLSLVVQMRNLKPGESPAVTSPAVATCASVDTQL